MLVLDMSCSWRLQLERRAPWIPSPGLFRAGNALALPNWKSNVFGRSEAKTKMFLIFLCVPRPADLQKGPVSAPGPRLKAPQPSRRATFRIVFLVGFGFVERQEKKQKRQGCSSYFYLRHGTFGRPLSISDGPLFPIYS